MNGFKLFGVPILIGVAVGAIFPALGLLGIMVAAVIAWLILLDLWRSAQGDIGSAIVGFGWVLGLLAMWLTWGLKLAIMAI